MSNYIYEMKNFQKEAHQEYLKTIKFINYREIIKAYASNPTDPDRLRDALGDGKHNFRILIDAPTGSGKTVLIANILKDFHKDYVCLVFSPGAGNLQEQTAGRLSEIMGESNVTLVDDTTFSQEFSTGIAYVGNWEKFVSREKSSGDYKNKIVREGDNRNFFDAVREVGNKGIPVIVCIDEAHHGKGSTISSIRTFLTDIKYALGYSPLYVEISATPILDGDIQRIKILLSDVQREELIRRNVRLNGADLLKKVNSLTNEQRASQEMEPFLIDRAIELQNQLDEKYITKDAHQMIDNQKVYFHSLIGLQIPNGPVGAEALARTESYLRDKYGITRDNDQLFVYLSDDNDKTTKKDLLKNIASAGSPVKVLIYKQGVTTGWDCPRAQILLGFRHITSKIFTKQNLGRYVRTTQQKYYGDDLLDYAYVISNVGDLGESSFGDDVDNTFLYEKESILRVDEQGCFALSSFNKIKLPKSHYSYTNQTRVPPIALKSKWATAAASLSLWDNLIYTNTSKLSQTKLISGEMGIDDLDSGKGFTHSEESKALAEDNGRQYRNLESMVLEVITENGRNYGANAQIARSLTTVIIKWYRDLVWGNKDANINHLGKRSDILAIIEAEKAEKIRFGETDRTDFAVEQLSLDPTHFKAVKKVINKTLESLDSTELMSEEEFREKGVPWAQRELVTTDGAFIISLTDAIWTAAVEDNLVGEKGIGSVKHYAYHLASDKYISYREGGAKLSGPEESFEKNFLPSIISSSDSKVRLAYYMKSPENNNLSYRIGVTSLDGSKVSDFYPDYIGEIIDPNLTKGSEYLPFIIEVKSEQDVLDSLGHLDSLLLGKAKALVDLSASYPVKAGIAYEVNHNSKNANWVVITSVSSKGKIETVGLKEWLVG